MIRQVKPKYELIIEFFESNGIEVDPRNNGAHLILNASVDRYDFWPAKEKFVHIKSGRYFNGKESVVQLIKNTKTINNKFSNTLIIKNQEVFISELSKTELSELIIYLTGLLKDK